MDTLIKLELSFLLGLFNFSHNYNKLFILVHRYLIFGMMAGLLQTRGLQYLGLFFVFFGLDFELLNFLK